MSIASGVHRFGPDNAVLSVRTGRGGAAAKAGHDLVIHVTDWKGSLELGDDPAASTVELEADATSLRVREASGGMQELGDDDRAGIEQTIDDEVLKRRDIVFRSTAVEGGQQELHVRGDLTLAGTTKPLEFDVLVGDDGAVNATAVVTQSGWGMKPYSALWGALKVLDEVEVVLEGHLGDQSR
jgi:polyisoprenoid-binding protein YceI